MKKLNMYFNIESVSEGQPDKVADQISELILDYLVGKDENAHVACEVYVTGKKIIVGGEVKLKNVNGNLKKDLEKEIRIYLKNELKYKEEIWPKFSNIEIEILLQEQSIEIDEQVSVLNNEIGAGDNTVVFGFANNDKKNEYFPKFQTLANKILSTIQEKRKKEKLLKFAPDGKIRITVENKNKPEKLIQIVLCQQFEKDKSINKNEIKEIIKKEIIFPILDELDINNDFDFKLIPFVFGGPNADTGLSGRKLMVDTYGTYSRHGGGSFAGKDVSKTDKTLALFARFIAKHIVALNLTDQIEVQMSSFIGETTDFSIIYYVKNEQKTNKESIKKIIEYFSKWSLKDIIKKLNLRKIKFINYAKYGYFGPNKKIPSWEKLNLLKELEKIIKN